MADCDDEQVVTMMDVLKEQEDFEEDANAVLGASDDKNCTYPKGYVKRQALYACLTCCPDAKTDEFKRAGVCLACSLNCHENHELIELYTKRNFRCDCGNPKFTSKCQFFPNKTDYNDDNKYNQNFSGLYCVCQRPYPDPEATEEDEMIQCIVCEDWLHTEHLEATVPLNDQYAEMICKACMENNAFLHDYGDLATNVKDAIVKVDFIDEILGNGDSKKGKSAKRKKVSNTDSEIEDKDVDVINNVETKQDTTKENETNENGETSNETIAVPTDSETKGDSNEEKLPENEEEKISENKGADENSIVDKPDSAINSDCEPSINQTSENIDEKPSDSDKAGDTNKESIEENNVDTTNTVKEIEKVADGDLSENRQTLEEEKPEETEIKPDSDKNESEITSTDVDMKENDNSEENKPSNTDDTTNDNKRKLDDGEDDQTAKKAKIVEPCNRPRGVKRTFKGATFWPSNFRQKLCTCSECLSMYKDLALMFLIDLDDTVTAYEALGKEDGDPQSQYERGLQALSSLDRVQQINALTEYNKMRDKLLDFLKSFKDRREIVKEEDIKAFFAGMKPKREPDGVYFCR